MTLRTINENLPLPILIVLVGILVALMIRPSATACFGDRSQANAQRGAEAWLRNRPTDPLWAPVVVRSARVQCLPTTTRNERWVECHIGPVDTAGTNYVVDCDTAEHNNIGCVSGR